MTKSRTAKTRTGRIVEIGTLIAVDGGYEGFVIGDRGYAVAVFVPS